VSTANLLTVGLVGTVSDALGRHKALMIPLVSGILSTMAVAMVPTGETCFVNVCVPAPRNTHATQVLSIAPVFGAIVAYLSSSVWRA
jgi:MFS family permease